MSRISPPASAIACAILATMPLRFLPVVVITARRPVLRRSCSRQEAHSWAASERGGEDGDGEEDGDGDGGWADWAEVTSAATIWARSARVLPARRATCRDTRAISSRRSALSSEGFTVELDAIHDGDDSGVDGNVWLLSRGQRRRQRDARGMAEGDHHVVARAGVEAVGAHHEI